MNSFLCFYLNNLPDACRNWVRRDRSKSSSAPGLPQVCPEAERGGLLKKFLCPRSAPGVTQVCPGAERGTAQKVLCPRSAPGPLGQNFQFSKSYCVQRRKFFGVSNFKKCQLHWVIADKSHEHDTTLGSIFGYGFGHTGSFRKNGKSKTVFMGTKFHEKLIFLAFFSRKLATNSRSWATRSVTITLWHPEKMAPPVWFQALVGWSKLTTASTP